MVWLFVSLYVTFAAINIASTILEIRKEVNRYGYITRKELVEHSVMGFFMAFTPILDFISAMMWGIPNIWGYICEKDWMNDIAFIKRKDE